MSSVKVPDDKNSHFWQWLKFWKIFDFSKENQIFFEKKSDFEKIIFSSKLCEKPQKRGFVVWNFYGAHFFRNLLYFEFRIKQKVSEFLKWSWNAKQIMKKLIFHQFWSFSNINVWQRLGKKILGRICKNFYFQKIITWINSYDSRGPPKKILSCQDTL